MLGRYLLPVVATIGVAVFTAVPVAAQPPSQAESAAVIVTPAMIAGCGTVFIEGTGYAPNEVVEVTVVTAPAAGPVTSAQDGPTISANPEGAFGLNLMLSSVGDATITATGTGSGLSAAAVATVVPPACRSVPVVGSLNGQMLWVGVVAVAGGALLVSLGTVLWRRRHHRASR